MVEIEMNSEFFMRKTNEWCYDWYISYPDSSKKGSWLIITNEVVETKLESFYQKEKLREIRKKK